MKPIEFRRFRFHGRINHGDTEEREIESELVRQLCTKSATSAFYFPNGKFLVYHDGGFQKYHYFTEK